MLRERRGQSMQGGTCARGTLSGSWTPKVMLYRMDSAKSTGSWLTMDTCMLPVQASGWAVPQARHAGQCGLPALRMLSQSLASSASVGEARKAARLGGHAATSLIQRIHAFQGPG